MKSLVVLVALALPLGSMGCSRQNVGAVEEPLPVGQAGVIIRQGLEEVDKASDERAEKLRVLGLASQRALDTLSESNESVEKYAALYIALERAQDDLDEAYERKVAAIEERGKTRLEALSDSQEGRLLKEAERLLQERERLIQEPVLP